MLGTVCHFGLQDHTIPLYHDRLQKALERVGNLLDKNGSFFFTVWSEKACKYRLLLSIYSDDEVDRVVRWTPTQEALTARLEKAKLRCEEMYTIEERLDLYHCRRIDAK
jgi:hypothetical protein